MAQDFNQDVQTAMQSVLDAARVRPDPEREAQIRNRLVRPVRMHASEHAIPLANIAAQNAASHVLDGRRSDRVEGPIEIASLASTLLAANRIVSFDPRDDGTTTTWRPNPSAGARHPIDLLVTATSVTGLDAGVWWFDPLSWALVPSEIDTAAALKHVGMATGIASPAAAIHLVATFERTLARYRNGTSLVWRDAGALMVVLQLAAIGVGLSACPVGTAGDIDLGDTSVDIGAVIVGPPRS